MLVTSEFILVFFNFNMILFYEKYLKLFLHIIFSLFHHNKPKIHKSIKKIILLLLIYGCGIGSFHCEMKQIISSECILACDILSQKQEKHI